MVEKRFPNIKRFFLVFSGTAFVCDHETGVIADPDDCRGFYICDFEHYEHFQCSPGYLFDPDLLVCNYEYEVDCGDRPIPGVSTTTSASTVSTTTVPTTVTSTTASTTTASTTTSSTTTASTTTASTTTTTGNFADSLFFCNRFLYMVSFHNGPVFDGNLVYCEFWKLEKVS